jgi:hypothetical protein
MWNRLTMLGAIRREVLGEERPDIGLKRRAAPRQWTGLRSCCQARFAVEPMV